ncbi:uncharacterized protein F4807DRAFT_415658 [Annulohypoxylon truncatum]|uniref:uncharacterized protein n=1 Tax=Annulohypoxylon truncatum TaxID=327061 RepID=UPI002007B7DF|nr:uncharacterized protein F4807DRAFT_415658 [Annulohypoxylon truncatum]KAI1212342.1 hypothetical protein F4807DRAFT_415658 [Annulohypoxylon truncatum]
MLPINVYPKSAFYRANILTCLLTILSTSSHSVLRRLGSGRDIIIVPPIFTNEEDKGPDTLGGKDLLAFQAINLLSDLCSRRGKKKDAVFAGGS